MLTVPALGTTLNLQTEVTAELAKKLPIDTAKLLAIVAAMRAADVDYRIAKTPAEAASGVGKAEFSTSIADIDSLDCSGFARYALFKASGGKVIMPDGSSNQGNWCGQQGLTAVSYKESAGLKDDHLRIAFFRGHPGHVWMILNGLTIESHGGVGPDRRSWSTAVLYTKASTCYILT